NDPALLREALDWVDPALIKDLAAVSPWANLPHERDRSIADLLSARSVPDAGTRRIIGAGWLWTIPSAGSVRPDGPRRMDRFVEFLTPGKDTPGKDGRSLAFAQALFDSGRCASDSGDWPKARREYQRSQACFADILPEDAWLTARSRFLVGSCQ